MRNLILFFLLLLISNCSKSKTVFICGDHVCVNKTEANQYLEENLSIEVKILKTKTKKKLKVLSKKEIVEIKENIKNKKKEKKLSKESKVARKINTNVFKKNQKQENNNIINSKIDINQKNVVDVCTIIEKCSIDEIAKFLLEQGNKESFPDITKRK